MENISTSQPSYLLHLLGTSTANNDADINDQNSYLLRWTEHRKLTFVVRPAIAYLPNKIAMCFLKYMKWNLSHWFNLTNNFEKVTWNIRTKIKTEKYYYSKICKHTPKETTIHILMYVTHKHFSVLCFGLKIEQTECFETLAIKLHSPENKQKEKIRYSEHG
jgi:hypothetical protein